MDIGPGDAVECVNAAPRHWDRRVLKVGAIYFVREVRVERRNGECRLCGTGCAPLAIEGFGGDFCPSRFRPYHGPEVEATQWKKSCPVYGKSPAFDMLNLVRKFNDERREDGKPK